MPNSDGSTVTATRQKRGSGRRGCMPNPQLLADEQTEPLNLITATEQTTRDIADIEDVLQIASDTHPLDLTVSPERRQRATGEAAAVDVIVLDDTLPELSNGEIIDLTSDDSIAMSGGIVSRVEGSATGRTRRHGQHRSTATVDDDTPLVAVRTRHVAPDADVMVIEKENKKNQAVDEYNSSYDPLTPKRKMLSCPICMDHERAIRRAGRSMMSTTCGHIFCNECIVQAISQMKCCPTCRKRLTKKTGIHPIFV